MKKPLALEIGGQRYNVKAADEAHAKRLAAFVNERLKEVQKRVKNASTHQQLILMALNIADELFGSEARRVALEESTRDTLRRVIAKLDRQVGGGAG